MFDKLFEPIRIGKVEIKNRLALSPMVAHDVGPNGEVTECMLRYYEERARGGAGLIITGTTVVYAAGRLVARNPSILTDDITYGWARWADAIHFHGAKCSIQIGHGGAQGPDILPELTAPSSVPRPFKRVPRALTRPEIDEIVEAFGKAALRIKNAGADFVEIHGANGYLIQEFCSPLSNKRDDIYGIDRFLFYVQILQRMRQAVGPDYPIVTGITAYEPTPGGMTIKDGQALAKRLVENGSDAIRLTIGTYSEIDYVIPPIYMYPEGLSYAMEAAKQIKKAVSVPVIAGTMVRTPALAEKAIAEGYADIVLLGRPLLADPEWPIKAREGRVNEIKNCIGCNECAARLFLGRTAYCAVNPYHNWEYRFSNPPEPAPIKKKVVVVGGGPGGCSAALTAAQRGHDVTLIERNQELGGTLIIGSKPAFKKPLASVAEWYKVQLPKAGVKMQLGKEATADSILKLKPDAVILATGSKPLKPQVRGVDNAVTSDDVLMGKVEVGKKVVVIGGGFVGIETALHLAQQGKQDITVVEMLDDILCDVNLLNKTTLLRMLGETKIKSMVGLCVEEIGKTVVIARDKRGARLSIPVETAILAVGRVADRQLEEQLRGKITNLRAIGDGVQARKVMDAVHEGFGAAMFL